jgi:hypothetical protein
MFEGTLFEGTVAAVANSPHWVDYMAALSGPVAGVIALFIALFSDRRTQVRFSKQLKQEAKLDEKADARQQAEWNRRSQEHSEQLELFIEAALRGMMQELIVVAMEAHEIALKPNDFAASGPKTTTFEISRPIFLSVKNRLIDLPDFAIRAICLFESQTDGEIIALRDVLAIGSKRRIRETANFLVLSCGQYAAAITLNEDGSHPTAERILAEAGIDGPAR